MANVTVGVKNFDRPAPAWYRKLSRGIIVFILPAIVGVVSGWGFAPDVLNHWLLVLSLIPAGIQGFGAFFGNGQEYTPPADSLPYNAPNDTTANKV